MTRWDAPAVRRPGALLRLAIMALAFGLPLVLGACGSGDPDPATAAPWTKPYSETSCDDWLRAMDPAQRWEMARVHLDLLDGDSGPVQNADVNTLQLAIGDYCRRPRDDIVAAIGERANLIPAAAAFAYATITRAPSPS